MCSAHSFAPTACNIVYLRCGSFCRLILAANSWRRFKTSRSIWPKRSQRFWSLSNCIKARERRESIQMARSRARASSKPTRIVQEGRESREEAPLLENFNDTVCLTHKNCWPTASPKPKSDVSNNHQECTINRGVVLHKVSKHTLLVGRTQGCQNAQGFMLRTLTAVLRKAPLSGLRFRTQFSSLRLANDKLSANRSFIINCATQMAQFEQL